MRLFGKNVGSNEAWMAINEAEAKLEAVINEAVGNNSKDYQEYDCEGNPYIYHGHKVIARINKNEIDAYWCEVNDDVAKTDYCIYCGNISYEELEARVVKYIKAMCQY